MMVGKRRTSRILIMTKNAGDLYTVQKGEPPELIDRGVGISGFVFRMGLYTVNMNHDGSCIAYLKNFDANLNTGDLYVKQGDREPELIDEAVNIGFGFF